MKTNLLNIEPTVLSRNVRSAAVMLGLVGIALMLTEGNACADYIVNGGFSSDTVPGGGNGLAFNTSTGASYLTGWTLTAPSLSSDLALLYAGNYGQNVADQYAGGFSLSDPSGITASPNGGNFITVDSDPNNSVALYQTLTSLSANTKYTLTFYQATDSQAGFSPSGTSDWSISFGNNTDGFQGYTSAPLANTTNFSGWEQITTTFTTGAHASSEILQFFAAGPSGGPPMLFLDGVSLNASATPEPSTLAIGGMGLLAIFRYCSKRRRQSPVN